MAEERVIKASIRIDQETADLINANKAEFDALFSQLLMKNIAKALLSVAADEKEG